MLLALLLALLAALLALLSLLALLLVLLILLLVLLILLILLILVLLVLLILLILALRRLAALLLLFHYLPPSAAGCRMPEMCNGYAKVGGARCGCRRLPAMLQRYAEQKVSIRRPERLPLADRRA
ncbi:hypothetical protein [Paracidovorax citrulli]